MKWHKIVFEFINSTKTEKNSTLDMIKYNHKKYIPR